MNEQIVETLRKIPLFQELSEASLTSLGERGEVEDVGEGDLIFSEGQRGDRFYVVLQGAVRIARQIEGVGEEQLSVCRDGQYFGELSLLDDEPRSADARANENSSLFVVRKSSLEEIMFSDPEFAREFLWVMVRHLAVRLRENNEKLRAVYQMGVL